MSVTIIEDFVSAEDCKTITESFDKLSTPHPHLFGYSGTLGFETSNQASLVSVDSPVLPLSGDEIIDNASILMTKYMLKLQKTMEKDMQQEMSLVNCNYVRMETGANNGLHADSTQLDGSPYHEGEELEFSGLIYFNEYGSDFTGGEIFFPKQDLVIKPKAGTAVFFVGDAEHPHSVKTVKSGLRKNIVLFFSKRGNTSDKKLFGDEHSGVPIKAVI
jgi:hypothetical protein